MLLAPPFALAHHIQVLAIDQQEQSLCGTVIKNASLESLLSPADRVVVGHWSRQTSELEQAFDHPHGLA